MSLYSTGLFYPGPEDKHKMYTWSKADNKEQLLTYLREQTILIIWESLGYSRTYMEIKHNFVAANQRDFELHF